MRLWIPSLWSLSGSTCWAYASDPGLLLATFAGGFVVYRLVSLPAVIIVTFLLSVLTFGADFSGRVVRVIDGDSIEVLHEGRAEQVRLNGIDCPELGQAFGRRAKQFTSEMAFGKEVTVKVTGHDRYGRTLGEFMLPDGRDLNRELVRAGFAWWFRRYAPNDRILERLETEARNARLGLWADPNPIPPWEYRRTHRRVDPK
jgi:micrococcal nuclease